MGTPPPAVAAGVGACTASGDASTVDELVQAVLRRMATHPAAVAALLKLTAPQGEKHHAEQPPG